MPRPYDPAVAREAEIVVVGAGITGLAAARALSRRGSPPLVLEQFRAGHTRGSSHGASRIFRLAYEDPRYVRLGQAALPLWRELEQEAGKTILDPVGALDVGRGLDGFATTLEDCGVPVERLDPDECRSRFPALAVDDDEDVLFQADGGVLYAERAQRSFSAGAVAEGAVVEEDVRVLRLEPSADGVRVVTDASTIEARRVVVTAGAWSKALLEGAGVHLRVEPTRETVLHFPFAPEGLPTLIDHGPYPPGQAAYSLTSPGIGLKAGIHQAGPPTDPDQEGAVDAEVVRITTDWVARRLRRPSLAPTLTETCIYTTAPQAEFVLERHGPIVVGSACSGHGFKFAPEIGRRLAELALED